MAFGESLHVDLYGVDPQLCDDLAHCYQLLDDLVAFLGMQKQSPPFVIRSPDQFPDKAGLSAWVPLIESGISIHTLTVHHFVTVDIYTCGQLKPADAVDFLYQRFKATRTEHHHLVRGITL